MPKDTGGNFEQILQVGRALAAELEPTDLLGRWMAHHLAELITAAEESGADATDPQALATAETILDLWAHRAGSPLRQQPLRSFDDLLAVLAEWTSPFAPWRLSRFFGDRGNAPTAADVEQHQLLGLAVAAEETVREVIRAAIAAAAQHAADREAPWLDAARVAGTEAERRVLRGLRRLQRVVWEGPDDASDAVEAPPATEESASAATDVAVDYLGPGRGPGIAELAAALDDAIDALCQARRTLETYGQPTDPADDR